MQDFGLQNLVDFFNQKRPKSLRRMRVYDSMNLEQFIDIFKQYFEALSQVETVKHRPDRFKRIENIKISSLSGVNALRNQGIAFTDFNEISQEDGLQDNDLNSIQPSQVPITIPKVNFDIIFLFLGDIFDSKILNDTESIEKHIEAFDSICRFQIYKPKMDHIQEEDIEDDEEQCIIEEEYIEKLKKEIMEKLASSGNRSKLITEKKLDELVRKRRNFLIFKQELENQQQLEEKFNKSRNNGMSEKEINLNINQQNEKMNKNKNQNQNQNQSRKNNVQNQRFEIYETQRNLALFLQEMCTEAIEMVESRIFQSYYYYVINLNFQQFINRLRYHYMVERVEKYSNKPDKANKQIFGVLQMSKRVNKIINSEFLEDKTEKSIKQYYQDIIDHSVNFLNKDKKLKKKKQYYQSGDLQYIFRQSQKKQLENSNIFEFKQIFTAEKDETQSEQVESQNILQKGLMKSYRSFGFLDRLNFSNKKQRNREQEESNLEEFESDINIQESDVNSIFLQEQKDREIKVFNYQEKKSKFNFQYRQDNLNNDSESQNEQVYSNNQELEDNFLVKIQKKQIFQDISNIQKSLQGMQKNKKKDIIQQLDNDIRYAEMQKKLIGLQINIIKEIDMIKGVKNCFEDITNQFYFGEEHYECFKELQKKNVFKISNYH